jgi:hypothetical protein
MITERGRLRRACVHVERCGRTTTKCKSTNNVNINLIMCYFVTRSRYTMLSLLSNVLLTTKKVHINLISMPQQAHGLCREISI